jgi:hypothetical protein
VSCSHEHAGFVGTVSISARTSMAVVEDIDEVVAGLPCGESGDRQRARRQPFIAECGSASHDEAAADGAVPGQRGLDHHARPVHHHQPSSRQSPNALAAHSTPHARETARRRVPGDSRIAKGLPLAPCRRPHTSPVTPSHISAMIGQNHTNGMRYTEPTEYLLHPRALAPLSCANLTQGGAAHSWRVCTATAWPCALPR